MRLPWWAGVALTTLASGCGADENCHIGTHVGAFTGDAAGEVRLAISRVDEDTRVDVTLTGANDERVAVGRMVAEHAVEGGCSDLTFEGDLHDDADQPIGSFEGVLTTTTGQGTWSLDAGGEGTWALGSM